MSHEQHPYQRNFQHRTDRFSACMQYCFHLHLSFQIYRIDTIPHFLRFVKPLPQIFFEKAGFPLFFLRKAKSVESGNYPTFLNLLPFLGKIVPPPRSFLLTLFDRIFVHTVL